MKAIHGGTATHERSDAPKIAGLRRGGLLPQASVDPAAMRASRALLRRRLHRMRHRAGRLAQSQQTNRQDHRPQIGKTRAYKANRGGAVRRSGGPAKPRRRPPAARLLRPPPHRARELVNTATAPDGQTVDRRRSLPGVGTSLALVRLSAIHAIHRFPRLQAWVADGRLGTGANESAGTRYGTAGAKSANAYRPWAFSEAAVLLVRNPPAGPHSRARLAKHPGKGNALTVLAHPRGPAVDDRLRRETAFDLANFVSAEGRGTSTPDAARNAAGRRLRRGLWQS
jgi:hypothetical protein